MAIIEDDFIYCEHEERERLSLVRLVLDRPDKLNSLPSSSFDALAEFFASINREDADVVSLTGSNNNFCVGADLDEFQAFSAEEVTDSATRMHQLVENIRSCPLPVIARIQGQAFGGGFMMAMASDFVVASTDARFGLQEVNLGVPVAGYTPAMLPRIVGDTVARDWLFTGREITASEAHSAGFVTSVAPAEGLNEAVTDILDHLESSSFSAINQLKENMADYNDLETVAATEREAIAEAYESGEVSENIKQFLDR